MLRGVAVLAVVIGVSGCGYTSEYEKRVYDMEPVYCYRTLAAVECQATPDRDRDPQLVNYYGPDPARTAPAEKPEYAQPGPPPAIDYWVKDAEPIPRPAPQGDLADRPWLQKDKTALQAPASSL